MQTNLIQTNEQKKIYKNWLLGRITDQEFDFQFEKTLGGRNK